MFFPVFLLLRENGKKHIGGYAHKKTFRLPVAASIRKAKSKLPFAFQFALLPRSQLAIGKQKNRLFLFYGNKMKNPAFCFRKIKKIRKKD